MSTGLPFLVQVKVISAVLNSAKHIRDLFVPAMRGESISFSDTLMLGAMIRRTVMIKIWKLAMMLTRC